MLNLSEGKYIKRKTKTGQNRTENLFRPVYKLRRVINDEHIDYNYLHITNI